MLDSLSFTQGSSNYYFKLTSEGVEKREDGLDRPEVVGEVGPRLPEVARRGLSSALQGNALHLRARRDKSRGR